MAEGGGLLNRYTVKSCIGGSNPPLSARILLRAPTARRLKSHTLDPDLRKTRLADFPALFQ